MTSRTGQALVSEGTEAREAGEGPEDPAETCAEERLLKKRVGL